MKSTVGAIALVAGFLALSTQASDTPAEAEKDQGAALVKPRQVTKDGEFLADSHGRVYRIFENHDGRLAQEVIFDPESDSDETGTGQVKTAESVDTSGRAPRCQVTPIYCYVPQYRPDGTTYLHKYICGWKQSGVCN